MPNRIIKESICSSCDINALTREEECFFYRLMVNCDDYGRMDGRAAVLRAKCYPLLLDKVSEPRVQGYLARLVKLGMVQVYISDDKPYVQITSWDRHQQVRAKRPKYPPPTCNQLISDDITCNQAIAHAPVIQSESESESESEKKPTGATAPKTINFDELFKTCFTFEDYRNLLDVYPDKVAFLMHAFKKLHTSAPAADFERCGGRLAGMYGKKNRDGGYILKVIWDTSSQGIAGSHLDYIDAALFRGVKGKVTAGEDPEKFVKGKYGHMVQR
jgi:hypothetical protein